MTTNLPIVYGFIIAAPTPFNTIFWQWLNQTYNAGYNYYNRNTTSKYTNSDVAKSYAGAVTISITTCLAIRKALEFKTRHLTGAKLMLFNTLSSFIACSIAGYLNALTMRRIELE